MGAQKVFSRTVLCFFLLIVTIFTNVKTGYSTIEVSLLSEAEMVALGGGDCACKNCSTVDDVFKECFHFADEGNEDCNTNQCFFVVLTMGSCVNASGGTCKMVSDSPNPMTVLHVRSKPNCNSSVDWHIWHETWHTSTCGTSECDIYFPHRVKCDTDSCGGNDLYTVNRGTKYVCVANCP